MRSGYALLLGAAIAFCAGTASGDAAKSVADLSAELSHRSAGERLQILAAGAKKEGALALYTSQQLNDTNPIVEAFEQKYGVKVTVWRAGPDKVVPRIINEARSRRDVFDAVETEGQALEALRREKLLQALQTPAIDTLLPQAVPAHHEWMGSRLLMFSQAYNTQQFKKSDLPRTWNDLLHPKWKGKLGIESKDDEWFYAVTRQLGGGKDNDKGVKLFRDIAATNGFSVRTGHSLLTNLVASGEVPLALNVYNARVQQLKDKGAPIAWFVLQPAIAQLNGVAVARQARHPYAALLFHEFMLTDAQAILAKQGAIPVSKAHPSPLADFPFTETDPAKVIELGDAWTQLYQDLIQGAKPGGK